MIHLMLTIVVWSCSDFTDEELLISCNLRGQASVLNSQRELKAESEPRFATIIP